MSDAVFFPGRPTKMGSNLLQIRTWINYVSCFLQIPNPEFSRMFQWKKILFVLYERYNHNDKTSEFSLVKTLGDNFGFGITFKFVKT